MQTALFITTHRKRKVGMRGKGSVKFKGPTDSTSTLQLIFASPLKLSPCTPSSRKHPWFPRQGWGLYSLALCIVSDPVSVSPTSPGTPCEQGPHLTPCSVCRAWHGHVLNEQEDGGLRQGWERPWGRQHQRCASADGAHLGDVREADQVGDDADSSNEELPAVAEESGVLIHQGRDEALHSAEL